MHNDKNHKPVVSLYLLCISVLSEQLPSTRRPTTKPPKKVIATTTLPPQPLPVQDDIVDDDDEEDDDEEDEEDEDIAPAELPVEPSEPFAEGRIRTFAP